MKKAKWEGTRRDVKETKYGSSTRLPQGNQTFSLLTGDPGKDLSRPLDTHIWFSDSKVGQTTGRFLFCLS